jgi:hypothetical protein
MNNEQLKRAFDLDLATRGEALALTVAVLSETDETDSKKIVSLIAQAISFQVADDIDEREYIAALGNALVWAAEDM